MRIKASLLCLSAAIVLCSCSKVSGVFEKKEDAPLPGERLSVLELQKSYTPDAAAQKQGVLLPATWKNDLWPQAAGFPNHSMQNLALNVSGLKKAWSASIGAGSSSELPLTARPIVINNTVFTMDTESTVAAFKADTGKKLWSTSVADKKEDEDVISGGIAFAGNSIFATNGSSEVLALDPDNGTIKWRKRLPAPSRAAPTALGGRVFVSTLDNRLFALNEQDGSSLWEYDGIGSTAGILGAASPAASTDIVVPAFASGEITALRVENGSVAWSDNLSNVRNYGGGLDSLSDIKAMPVMDSNLVIAMSFSGKMAAIDQTSGTRVWQREIGGSATPWTAGNTVFVLSEDDQLIALRIKDGAILWVTQIPRFQDEKKKKNEIFWTAPLLANGKLILTGSNEKMLIVDALSGKIESSKDIGKHIVITPVIANNTIYILAQDGTLLAYR